MDRSDMKLLLRTSSPLHQFMISVSVAWWSDSQMTTRCSFSHAAFHTWLELIAEICRIRACWAGPQYSHFLFYRTSFSSDLLPSFPMDNVLMKGKPILLFLILFSATLRSWSMAKAESKSSSSSLVHMFIITSLVRMLHGGSTQWQDKENNTQKKCWIRKVSELSVLLEPMSHGTVPCIRIYLGTLS